MVEPSRHWASGNWQVVSGKAGEFVQRWTEFLTWTKEANDGFGTAWLIRDGNDPNHFLSFASWRDGESLSAWRQKPEFAKHFGACRALCQEMRGGNFELASAV